MGIRQLVEVAALASAHHAHLIERNDPIPDEPLQQYWQLSRERTREWMRTFEEFSQFGVASGHIGDHEAVIATIEEIFVSDIFVRVWASILTASDTCRGVTHARPIASSTLIGHMEARHQAMSLMVSGSHLSMNSLTYLDRVRRRVERWTDLLLGGLIGAYDVGSFAFEERRAWDFVNDQIAAGNVDLLNPVWTFTLTSLQAAFPDKDCSSPKQAQLQQQILNSVFACFPNDAFEPDGPFKSLAWLRVSRSANQDDQRPQANAADIPQTVAAAKTTDPTGIQFAKLRRQP